MIIPIVYPSALQFWMNSHLLNYSEELIHDQRFPVMMPAQYQLSTKADLGMKLARRYGFTLPITVMAPNKTARRESSYFHSVLKPCHLPAESFIELDNLFSKNQREPVQILLSTPEFCFLEAATDLSLLELIQLGYDLCAIYLPDSFSEFNQINRKAITTQQAISEYLNSAVNVKGVQKARRAISYVLDNSNSPMETMIAIIMTLPRNLGGYGIIKPQLNKKIMLSSYGSQLLHRNYCICDAVWPLQKVILEYDSNMTHLNPEQHKIDKARLNALSMSGYHVISITADAFRNLSTMDSTFTTLRWTLGLHKELKCLEKYSEERRALLKFFKSKQSNDPI